MHSYNHRVVQDLSWVISSDTLPLVLEFSQQHSSDVYIPDNKWFRDQYNSLHDWLLRLDQNPYELQRYLSSQNTFRLGFYYESLVNFWLTQSPQFEVLFKNQILSYEGKTTGEFDFIIRDNLTDKIIHLETAVKFYLELQLEGDAFYVGPNLNDRYDKKLQRLFRHQLLLSEHAAAASFLRDHHIKIDERWLFLKGRLFSASATCMANSWLTLSDFRNSAEESSNYIILPRLFWLSEVSNIEYNFLEKDVFTQRSLFSHLLATDFSQPVCIARIENDKELFRCFIAPDDWQENARQFLTS